MKNIYGFFISLIIASCCFTSCSKENITDEISNTESQITNNPKIETIDTIGVALTQQRLEQIFNNQILNLPKLKSTTPTYVGVISNDRTCGLSSNVYGVIEYSEDLEDNRPASGYQNTTGTLNITGLKFDSNKNATWYVCVVDGSNFVKINNAYAIFALSPQTFLNSSNHVMLSADDEDVSSTFDYNSSHYISSPNLGFMPSSSGLPVQAGSFTNGSSSSDRATYTNYQFYFFEKTISSSAKLPNLGFAYTVFGNFGISAKQNRANFDLEDSNCHSGWTIYYSSNGTKSTVPGKLDPNNNVMTQAGNVDWYIQSAVGFTY